MVVTRVRGFVGMPQLRSSAKPNRVTAQPVARDWSRLVPLAILAFGAVLWGTIVYRTHFQLEDALITYRYSANIVAGNGFVFNPGERVLGTTTPLVTLLLALVSLPFGSHAIRQVATVFMPLFGLLAGLAAYVALTKRGISVAAAGVVMFLLYAHIAFIRTGIGGMETPAVLLLMGLSLWALGSDRPVLMGALCGLIVLCRIDGAIWAALITLALLMRSWRKAAISTGVGLLVVLPWIIFATVYFGSFLPNSMLAKAVVRPGRESLFLSGEQMLKYALWYVQGTGLTGSLYLLPLWLGVLVLGARRLLRRNAGALWPVVAFPLVYAFAMYAGRSPRFEWYLLPITFTCMIMLGVGLVEVYGFATRAISAKARTAIAGVIVVAAVVVYCFTAAPTMIRRMAASEACEDSIRAEVGRWLHANTPRDATVAMEAIGYQGYYSERRIIDLAGLVTPRVVEFKRSTGENGEVFEDVRRFLKPDYIVLRSFEVDTNHHFNGGLMFLTEAKEREFRATYREIRRFDAPGSPPSDLLCHLTLYGRGR